MPRIPSTGRTPGTSLTGRRRAAGISCRHCVLQKVKDSLVLNFWCLFFGAPFFSESFGDYFIFLFSRVLKQIQDRDYEDTNVECCWLSGMHALEIFRCFCFKRVDFLVLAPILWNLFMNVRSCSFSRLCPEHGRSISGFISSVPARFFWCSKLQVFEGGDFSFWFAFPVIWHFGLMKTAFWIIFCPGLPKQNHFFWFHQKGSCLEMFGHFSDIFRYLWPRRAS